MLLRRLLLLLLSLLLLLPLLHEHLLLLDLLHRGHVDRRRLVVRVGESGSGVGDMVLLLLLHPVMGMLLMELVVMHCSLLLHGSCKRGGWHKSLVVEWLSGVVTLLLLGTRPHHARSVLGHLLLLLRHRWLGLLLLLVLR